MDAAGRECPGALRRVTEVPGTPVGVVEDTLQSVSRKVAEANQDVAARLP